ncbi:glycosyltransferase [Actinorugispora endophytica]|uniref:Glycosyltransferase involved in cell wall biosynthesis n=1 Tax=Actinorugispora endophytica TaxID=1605990 RepID=A0A4R6UVW7_9ACTN|nr:glycosyltransferase [Actinorugispora endophytica]TDQ51538.1 glycosyltransferase involved in cell wall biosynthesis [Actinorugispora endophytica]
MKIAMVSEHASPLATLGGEDAGGQNVHVAELALALAGLGHEVTVYTRRADRDQPDDVSMGPGVRVRHVRAGPARVIGKDELPRHMPGFARRLRADWAEDPPDIVHAHFWMSGLAALDAAEGTGVPVVQTFHALGVVKRRHQGEADTSPAERIEVERSVALRSAMVVATSNEELRELRSWGVRPDRLAVVPCGVDLEHFTPRGPRAPRGPRPRVVSLGRLVERKGVETLVRALPWAPDAELLVAGGPARGRLRSDPEAVRLHRAAQEAGVADRVRFLGQVERADVPALLRSADVSVNVPWYEPFGMSTVEAMACGVPVIASNVGGHLDTVVHEVTGLLVPPRDPATLGLRLRELLADVVAAESYGIAGADRAAARYSWPFVAYRIQECYAGVLREAARPRGVPGVRRPGPRAHALTGPGARFPDAPEPTGAEPQGSSWSARARNAPGNTS